MSEPPRKLAFAPEDDRLDYQLLLCPRCGDGQTHIDDVYVYGRPREDGPIIAAHVDYRGEVERDHNSGGKHWPGQPDRRHAIVIEGYCEPCGERFAFNFLQHKGETQVYTLFSTWTLAKPAPGR